MYLYSSKNKYINKIIYIKKDTLLVYLINIIIEIKKRKKWK